MGGPGTAVGKKGKALCSSCSKKCSGEVLKVHEQYFHISCFKCKACKKSLAQGGFFTKDGEFYCTEDYQRLHGTQCAVCGRFVEGEVVTALGNTYHQGCFRCARCRQSFPAGESVTFTGKECLCHRCAQIPVIDAPPTIHSPAPSLQSGADLGRCTGCHQDLNESQALIALDKPWHIWCFKCSTCKTLLHGEYMARDGKPFCEKHYQSEYGVKCAYCQRYISGKVLQAGDNHHFHPTCARCTKCGDPFGDGEEMYLQGAAIWHPRCGPGPSENGVVINGQDMDDLDRSTELDRLSTTASETQFSFRSHSRTPSISGSCGIVSPYSSFRKYSGYRSTSPGLLLREYRSNVTTPIDVSRIYTQSYLADGPSMGYLRRPIEPYDKPPKSPHFHRPPTSVSSSGRRLVFQRPGSRSGMQALVDHMESETPRPRSPYMNNEEPIELSHYPDGKRPAPNEQAPIERDDFPAPPYPYTDPERRRRLSEKSSVNDADEELGYPTDEPPPRDAKLMREEAELNKIPTGIGKVFLEQVKEREKLRQWKLTHVDPRSLSRAPNADRELPYRLRYQSSVYASPSRDTDHLRQWEMEEEFERGSTYRSSLPGRSFGAAPNYRIVRSSMSAPRPGYGLKSATLPAQLGRPSTSSGGYYTDYSYGGLGEKTHSTDFSIARSDVSIGSLTEADRNALNQAESVSVVHGPRSATALRYDYISQMRRSMPTMLNAGPSAAPLPPAKVYPAHLLFTTNYRLPADVDRNHLERHLSDVEFELVFHVARQDFYRLPLWRRSDLKKRVRLF